MQSVCFLSGNCDFFTYDYYKKCSFVSMSAGADFYSLTRSPSSYDSAGKKGCLLSARESI